MREPGVLVFIRLKLKRCLAEVRTMRNKVFKSSYKTIPHGGFKLV